MSTCSPFTPIPPILRFCRCLTPGIASDTVTGIESPASLFAIPVTHQRRASRALHAIVRRIGGIFRFEMLTDDGATRSKESKVGKHPLPRESIIQDGLFTASSPVAADRGFPATFTCRSAGRNEKIDHLQALRGWNFSPPVKAIQSHQRMASRRCFGMDCRPVPVDQGFQVPMSVRRSITLSGFG